MAKASTAAGPPCSVEVLADGRRAQPEAGAEIGRGGLAQLQEQLRDPVTGAPVRRGSMCCHVAPDQHLVFHYSNVTYFVEPLQTSGPVIRNTPGN
jgi:hypothetical protein